MMKTFPQFTREYIREELSYENLIYLLSVIPPYRGWEDRNKNNKTTPKRDTEKVTHFEQFNF